LGIAWLGVEGSSLLLNRLKQEGSEAVWSASARTLSGWGLRERAIRRYESGRREFDTAKARAMLEKLQQWFVPYGSSLYPAELTHLDSPPAGLFVRGGRETLERVMGIPRMTVVGTRKASMEGVQAAKSFSAALCGRGVAVLSGMALGIDGHAHASVLDRGGLTVAVLGCGADVVYPPRHRWLYSKIVNSGLVVTEFPPHSQAMRWTFPQRNRVLAALGDAVLVVEGGNTSGALQTARWALDLGRPVFAVPASIFRSSGEGCNSLIYDGARPALDPDILVEDFLRCTRMERGGRVSSEPVRVAIGEQGGIPGVASVTEAHTRVLEALKEGPVSIDGLVRVIGLSVREVSSALGELEIDGAVVRAGPGLFLRAP